MMRMRRPCNKIQQTLPSRSHRRRVGQGDVLEDYHDDHNGRVDEDEMERDKRAGINGEIFFQKNEKSLTTNVAGGVVTLMISKQTPEDGDDGGSTH